MAAQQFKACDPVLDDGQDKQSENHGAFGGGLDKTIDGVQKPARNQVKGSYHRSDSQEAVSIEKHSQRDHDSGNVKTQPSLSVGTEQETSSPLEGDVAATLTRIKDHYSILSTPSESRSADSIAPSASVLEVPVEQALSAFSQQPQSTGGPEFVSADVQATNSVRDAEPSLSTSTQDKKIPVLENTPQQPVTYGQAIDAPGPADQAVASGRDPQQGRDSAFSSVTGSSNERGEDDEFHHAGARAGDSSPDVLTAAASSERSLPSSARDRSSYYGRGEQAVGAKSSSAIAATARDDSGRPVARNQTPPNLPRPPLASSSPAVSGNFQARAPVPGPPGVVGRPVAADLGIQRRDVQEGAGEGDLELQLGIRVRDPDGAVNLRRAREARRLASCLACWEHQPEVFLRDCGHHILCRRCFMDPDQPGLLPGMLCPTCLRPMVAVHFSREMRQFLYIRSTQPFFHAL